MQKNWYLKSYHVPKCVTCACAKPKTGYGFELKMFKEILLTGAKFYRNSSSGSGVKCCTFKGLSTQGAAVACLANYQVGTYHHNYSNLVCIVK